MHKEFIVQMGAKYPFGELGEVINENTSTSVCKTLFHSSRAKYEAIQQMVHFLKATKHQYLINLKQVLQCQAEIRLYYQYVPFRLEGWLLDVNEQLINQLEKQFLQLSEYLSRSNIKFTLDPECVGVSAQMNLKYFLRQFVIDKQNNQKNLQNVQKQIKLFFNSLKQSKKKADQLKESTKAIKDMKRSLRMESISTNGSYSTQDDLSSLTQTFMRIKIQTDRSSKEAIINARVQNSKRKCNQILERFKNINSK